MDTATAAASDPRIERTRQVVLDAVLALVAESGYGAVTIEAVAARSGVAKSTIYRHWPGRAELVNDAFRTLQPPVYECQGGDVRSRVVQLLEELAERTAESTLVGVPAVARRRRGTRPRGARGAAQPARRPATRSSTCSPRVWRPASCPPTSTPS